MAASDSPNPLRQTVGRALGRIPSGVFILTTVPTEPPGRFPLAMMVSWVQQAAFRRRRSASRWAQTGRSARCWRGAGGSRYRCSGTRIRTC